MAKSIQLYKSGLQLVKSKSLSTSFPFRTIRVRRLTYEKRQLGNSDLFVTEMGLGCMSLGTSEAEAMRIIDEAIDLGINFFDTADLYDYGLNEEFVGKALKGKRDQIVLTTKVGNRWTEEKNGWSWDPSKNYIKAEVKESLRRLQTDYIDLYQLHGGTIEDPIDETIEAFEELKKKVSFAITVFLLYVQMSSVSMQNVQISSVY